MATLKYCVLAALLSVTALGARDASALSYLMMQDETLLEQAEGVALFEVTAVSASPQREETRYGLRRVARFGGMQPALSETLVLPGYVTKNEQLVFDGIPSLPVGQRVLLFHTRRDDGVLQAVQLTLGMFFPIVTKQGEIYQRYLGAGNDLSEGRNASYARPRDARGFERWVTLRDAGRAAEPDYLLERIPAGAKFNLTQVNLGGTPRPARWFQFEEGTTMHWFATAEGQQGTTLDEFAIFQQGIASWSSDSGSLILMDYAGTGVTTSSTNANLSWNDPDNQVPGEFTCPGGGVLGAGGSLTSTPARTFDDGLWYQRSRGRLITQPGTGCFFNQYGVDGGAEFFVHEIGHVLGFQHSCGQGAPAGCQPGSAADDATMRDVLHVDGRGAELQPDDIAAARFAYQDSAPAPVADLSLSLEASPPVVPIGQTITYDIDIANAGPDAAVSLVVTHALPPDTQFEGAAGAGWSCTSAGSTVTCTRPSLAGGASAAIEVLVDVPLDYAGSDALVSQASVDSTTDDPAGGNNSGSVTTLLDRIIGRIFGDGFE